MVEGKPLAPRKFSSFRHAHRSVRLRAAARPYRAPPGRAARCGAALVVNDTKVLPVALHGRRIGGGDREPGITATLIKRLDGSRWRALVKPAKRLTTGDVVRFGAEGRGCFLEQLDAAGEEKSG